MRIIAFGTLKQHWEKPGRADSEGPLRAWFTIVKSADWATPAALKDQFRSASFVGDRGVVNVGGNKYRLVVYPNFEWRTVYVRFVGTHAEYDATDVATV
jgi:mRNA interferase HigB